MTSERAFQSTLLSHLRERGYAAYNMETNQPGFPDVWAQRRSESLLIEVKAEAIGANRQIRGILSKAQLPWWVDYLTTSNADNLWLVIKSSIRRHYVLRLTLPTVKQIADGATLSSLIVPYHETTTEALEEVCNDRQKKN